MLDIKMPLSAIVGTPIDRIWPGPARWRPPLVVPDWAFCVTCSEPCPCTIRGSATAYPRCRLCLRAAMAECGMAPEAVS